MKSSIGVRSGSNSSEAYKSLITRFISAAARFRTPAASMKLFTMELTASMGLCSGRPKFRSSSETSFLTIPTA